MQMRRSPDTRVDEGIQTFCNESRTRKSKQSVYIACGKRKSQVWNQLHFEMYSSNKIENRRIILEVILVLYQDVGLPY